jgi:hypothetical protein
MATDKAAHSATPQFIGKIGGVRSAATNWNEPQLLRRELGESRPFHVDYARRLDGAIPCDRSGRCALAPPCAVFLERRHAFPAPTRNILRAMRSKESGERGVGLSPAPDDDEQQEQEQRDREGHGCREPRIPHLGAREHLVSRLAVRLAAGGGEEGEDDYRRKRSLGSGVKASDHGRISRRSAWNQCR